LVLNLSPQRRQALFTRSISTKSTPTRSTCSVKPPPYPTVYEA
jgi:hypothetical protein